MINLEVLRVEVVTGSNVGTDRVYLVLNVPNGCFPFGNEAPATVHAAAGTGVEWVRKHLRPEEIHHLNIDTGIWTVLRGTP